MVYFRLIVTVAILPACCLTPRDLEQCGTKSPSLDTPKCTLGS